MTVDTARWGRLAGLVAGIAAAVAVAFGPDSWLGTGQALAVPVFAAFLLAGVLGGELLTPRPSGPARVAMLEVRRVRAYLPRRSTRAAAVTVALLAAVLVAAAVTGSADDLGRAGRSLTLTCEIGSSAAGPWPGAWYGAPIAATVLAGLLVAAAALRTIIRRARPATDPFTLEADDERRRRSAGAVVSACGLLAAAPLAGVSLVAGGAMIVVADGPCAAPGLHAAGWLAIAFAFAAGVTACVFAAQLLTARRLPA